MSTNCKWKLYTAKLADAKAMLIKLPTTSKTHFQSCFGRFKFAEEQYRIHCKAVGFPTTLTEGW